MEKLDFIYKRHSVRKFEDKQVPEEDLKEIIKAATYSASAKNIQNWHFVIVRNNEKIQEMAKIVERKNAKIAEHIKDEDKKKSFTKFLRFSTAFRNAPTVILVYAGPYDPTGLDVIENIPGYEKEVEDLLKREPRIQNIGACMENLALAAANMGYGTCWMTSQNYAANEISDFIGYEKEDFYLVAMMPLGVPQGPIKSPKRKPVEEVMTIVE